MLLQHCVDRVSLQFRLQDVLETNWVVILGKLDAYNCKPQLFHHLAYLFILRNYNFAFKGFNYSTLLNTFVAISWDIAIFCSNKHLFSRNIKVSECCSNDSFRFHVSIVNSSINNIDSSRLYTINYRSKLHNVIIFIWSSLIGSNANAW